ncbi:MULTISPECIES: TetR/AcrR family transcriptional regulator [Rhizobium]|uniref:TetR/AcrR family transcriptional regulator n=1 Tax=Rhizobium rhododendri TaxID=2506430 RepID=A0ABY8IRX6_9HYPH|nr:MULTISPECIES: TetR/AcrR family transcriptional regulator [Rhizobium]TQX84455.1 TetR/AcrR family transcriptional regulator [Rhizobium sp. rho-13.1]TQY08198.1 TetR/AcrR family transcriptional regulator [Rhizobium sp. rho-1.1]WFS26286.1 TetR/AcrR family transcriptional regulator [Rhizobium rhododendri]
MAEDELQAVKRKPVQARSRKIKAAIMDAAHEVMRTHGIRAITTNAVAERAGVKVGSIYDYFPNKEAIIAEIYEEKLGQVRAFLERGSEAISPDDWQDQLAELIRATWAYQLSIGLDRTIVDASYYYEDLLRIARSHSMLFASNYVRLLQRLGSSWPEDHLFDLGISIYTLVNATWSYWRLTESEDPVAIERQIMATLTLIEPAFAHRTNAD